MPKDALHLAHDVCFISLFLCHVRANSLTQRVPSLLLAPVYCGFLDKLFLWNFTSLPFFRRSLFTLGSDITSSFGHKLHDGFWIMKWIVFIVLHVASVFMPAETLKNYSYLQVPFSQSCMRFRTPDFCHDFSRLVPQFSCWFRLRFWLISVTMLLNGLETKESKGIMLETKLSDLAGLFV